MTFNLFSINATLTSAVAVIVSVPVTCWEKDTSWWIISKAKVRKYQSSVRAFQKEPWAKAWAPASPPAERAEQSLWVWTSIVTEMSLSLWHQAENIFSVTYHNLFRFFYNIKFNFCFSELLTKAVTCHSAKIPHCSVTVTCQDMDSNIRNSVQFCFREAAFCFGQIWGSIASSFRTTEIIFQSPQVRKEKRFSLYELCNWCYKSIICVLLQGLNLRRKRWRNLDSARCSVGK